MTRIRTATRRQRVEVRASRTGPKLPRLHALARHGLPRFDAGTAKQCQAWLSPNRPQRNPFHRQPEGVPPGPQRPGFHPRSNPMSDTGMPVSSVRAIRGAIQLDVDEREHVLSATRELVVAVLEANALTKDDVISIMFTATHDVRSEFPAVAARELGLGDVPLMCAQELDIVGAMPRVIRLMVHVSTTMPRDQITHVYLRGATALRRDLAQ